ncbi:rho GTPase-activating protein gacJ-like isoform X1 [Carassius auratus]|uniref:Rho GTPase-activating protein gacJ-like isoform X1 n=1 Tax=Carassius auratus TaxID=7957 RepID=A0A6P6Q7W5_CARAU|nr:rho GTPase-activating protein gacJ-like isoform X1 [Carassius auratus]
MAGLTDERLRVVAIIHALKAVGIRVKSWKNFLNGDSNGEQTFTEESVSQRFAFSRDLHLLPQHELSDMGGTVPQFLVEACGYLSQHLDTEGLFRKTGSLSRIRALRADLEQGKPVFLPPHASLLQPSDVASLIKQFLRELPSPLIPADLQIPLIQAQGLEMIHDQEGARNRTTLLITALFPSSHARALRYLCTFLHQVAERGSENRMDATSLAVVIAPNLLQSPTPPCKLTLDTEKHLDQQTSVIKSLILHADRIGVVPLCVLEASKATLRTETPSPAGGAMYSKRTGLSVYRSLRRQRRRSVGEIFVDAFSKLKPCRTLTGPLIVLDVTPVTPLSKSPTPQSPVTVKRKATEESLPEIEGSARKRRSLHDLREDAVTPISQPEECASSHSPLEEKCRKEDPIPTTSKKRNQLKEQRKSLGPPAREEKVHRRRKSLRFFTESSGNNSNPLSVTPTHKDPENCLEEHQEQPDSKSGSPLTNADVSPKIPLILIDGPGGVVVENEVDDDPDLLNCTFAESPNDSQVSCIQRQNSEQPSDDESWTVLETEDFVQLGKCEVIQSVTQNKESQINASTEVENEREVKQPEAQPRKKSKKVKKSSKNRSRPRRSISLPEVTLELCTDEIPELEKEVGRAETEMDNAVWPTFASPTLSNEQKKVCVKEMQEPKVKTFKNYKQDKMTDSTVGFKRPHLRLSMAERLRGFSALTLLLRTSRTAPQFQEKPQEALQRGPTRLRRQGARRFSRSFSHEGVPERPLEQSPVGSPPVNQAFIGIHNASPDSGVESFDHEPIIDFKHQEVCNMSQYYPNVPMTKDVDVNSLSSLENPNQDPGLPTRDKTKNQFPCKQTEQDVEQLDLHKLLAQKCHIGGHGKDGHQDSSVPEEILKPDLASPMSFEQTVPLKPFEDTSSVEDFKTDQVSPLNGSEKETASWLNASPPFVFPNFAPLSYVGVISENDTCNRSPCDLSPPAFQFRHVTARRHYRDSPRWPSHEVRMSAWNPLPL